MPTATTEKDEGKLDNMTVRRFAKLIKNGGVSVSSSSPITTGTVVQNDNVLYVAVDNDSLIPITDTSSNVSLGDRVSVVIDGDHQALIVGNNSDKNATSSEVEKTDEKADQAQQSADEASKVATNYIRVTENDGIIIGDLTKPVTGKNSYMDTKGFSIRDGDTCLAHFYEDEIALGENTDTSQITLCGEKGYIKYNDTDNNLVIGSPSASVDFECSGTLSQNGTAVSLEGHVHEGLFVIKEVTLDYTISPSSHTQYSFPLPMINGYTPFSVCSFTSGWVTCFVSSYSFTTSRLGVNFYNIDTSSTLEKTATFKIAYIKDGWTEEAE